ncbi:IS66-like element accessory protein TnpA [Escherichia coli]|uniref:IS66-like element accessory protein TnpA n=1 Tax=Escherichia coli TaxID=562 RepID=UPI00207BC272|nr:transposase [Escherichia coli]
MQKNVTPGRRKGCPNYPPEFKQQLVAASCEPGISISKLALENGINANLLFKWRQQWREGKLLLPSSESPQLLPVTLDAAAEQPESLAEDPEPLSISPSLYTSDAADHPPGVMHVAHSTPVAIVLPIDHSGGSLAL